MLLFFALKRPAVGSYIYILQGVEATGWLSFSPLSSAAYESMSMTPNALYHLSSVVVLVSDMYQVGEILSIKRQNVLDGKEKEAKGTLKICIFQG